MNGPLIGILGGMGPLATAHFMTHLATLAKAERDQDHCRTLVYSNPRIPDRSDALTRGGLSPLAGMAEGVALLERIGADVIAIPCNTAHAWMAELKGLTKVPMISIVDAVISDIAARRGRGLRVGVLGTSGMLRADLYQRGLGAAGHDIVLVEEEGQAVVQRAIQAVKAGRVDLARASVLDVVEDLGRRGVQAVVLACTELPVAVPEHVSACGVALIDSTRCLAAACLAWAEEAEGALSAA